MNIHPLFDFVLALGLLFVGCIFALGLIIGLML